MAEVLVGGVKGPIGAEVPDDVVCNGPPNQSSLGQEKQVHFGLPAELKETCTRSFHSARPHVQHPLVCTADSWRGYC